MDESTMKSRLDSLQTENAWLRAEVTRLTAALNGTLIGEDDAEKPRPKHHNTRRIGGLEWAVDLPLPMPWQHAVEYAEILEKIHGGGWRLPTVGELVSLWGYGDGSGLFPPEGGGVTGFWAAHRYDVDFSWCVWMPDGMVDAQDVGADRYVRCVRTVTEGA